MTKHIHFLSYTFTLVLICDKYFQIGPYTLILINDTILSINDKEQIEIIVCIEIKLKNFTYKE